MTADPGPVDWRAADLFLIREVGIPPWDLDRLTLSEMCLALEDLAAKRPPGGASAATPDELQAYAAKMRAMTLRDKLDAAREGRL